VGPLLSQRDINGTSQATCLISNVDCYIEPPLRDCYTRVLKREHREDRRPNPRQKKDCERVSRSNGTGCRPCCDSISRFNPPDSHFHADHRDLDRRTVVNCWPRPPNAHADASPVQWRGVMHQKSLDVPFMPVRRVFGQSSQAMKLEYKYRAGQSR
jgi:hypothetical protein